MHVGRVVGLQDVCERMVVSVWYWNVKGVCVGHGRVVESVGCVCWEDGGECSMCIGRLVVM